ncbi:MAG: TraM recognition domain-containing protein [Pseudomonadota bacterium]
MRESNTKIKGVDSTYQTYLRHTIDIRSNYKYFSQEVITNPVIISIPLIISIILTLLIPALIIPLVIICTILISIHRANQKQDIPNRLPIYVKTWWGVSPKLRMMKSIANGIVFVGNLRFANNQETWNSKEQELKHKMDNTGTGGGKTTSIISGMVPAFGNSGQVTLSEAKGDANVARIFINIAREFWLEDDVHVTTYATSNAPKERGYKRSHSTNLHTGNDSAATNEIILGLLPSSNGQNSVFVQRATVLGKIANELVYEKAANTDDENNRVSLQAMRKMLNLKELKSSLSSTWLKRQQLRDEVTYYLRDLQVDINNSKKDPKDKSMEQHMYAQMYFTKGLSTLTDSFGFIFNKQYGDYVWSDILNRKRSIYQLIPAIDKSETEMEYISKIHAQLILNAVKTFLDPKIQGRGHEINQRKHVDFLSKLIIDEFTFLVDSSVPIWIAQVRSMYIAVGVYFQSLQLTEEINKKVMIAIENISGTLSVGQTNDEKARDVVIKAAGQTTVARPKHVERDKYSYKYRISKTLDLEKVNIFEHDDIIQQTYGESHTVFVAEKDKQTGNNLALRLSHYYIGDRAFSMLEKNDDITLLHFIEHTNRVRPRKNTIKLTNLKKKSNKPILTESSSNSLKKLGDKGTSTKSQKIASQQKSNNNNSKGVNDETMKIDKHKNNNIKVKKVIEPRRKKNNLFNKKQLDLFGYPDEAEDILDLLDIEETPTGNNKIDVADYHKSIAKEQISEIQKAQPSKTNKCILHKSKGKPKIVIENKNQFLSLLPNEIKENIESMATEKQYNLIFNSLPLPIRDNDFYNYPSDNPLEDEKILEFETFAILDLLNKKKDNDQNQQGYQSINYDNLDLNDFVDIG